MGGRFDSRAQGSGARFRSPVKKCIFLFFLPLLAFMPHVRYLRGAAQNPSDTPGEEVVANLAAGRVIVAVVKDAILIGTIENPIEAQTHVPAPVGMSGHRAGILLGAVDWFSPSTQLSLGRLDKELPHLRSRATNAGPHLEPSQSGAEAADIEMIGQGLLERLSVIAKNLHGRIELPANEPIAELVITGYAQGYGAEVWQLTYPLKQELERGDFWDTRVGLPAYLQFWPPEKGKPHTLLEFNYPPENPPAALIDLLRQNDPRLQSIRTSDPKMAEVAEKLLRGESNKISSTEATQFLRAAMSAVSPPKSRQTFAVISEDSGFDWILPPPPEPKGPNPPKEREPEAPTLVH